MRSCRQCGVEFGLYRHFFLRSEFCTDKCADAFRLDTSRLAIVRQAKSNERDPADDRRQETNSVAAMKSDRGVGPFVDPLQEGRPEPVLYFIGADLPEFRLAQLMGPGSATFGVKARWPVASGEGAQLPTMEQITAPYAAAIAAHAPATNCVLAGYSFYGLIAYAAARQLLKQGVNVEAVILIDARTRYPLQSREVMRKKLQAVWARPLGVGLGDRMTSFVAALAKSWSAFQWMLALEGRSLARRYSRAILRDPGPISDWIDSNGKRMYSNFVDKVIRNAGRHYELGRVDCRGILICVNEDREMQARELDPSAGWGALFERGLEIVDLPGNHITIMLSEPHKAMLARTLKETMSRFRDRQSERNHRRVRQNSEVS